MNFDLRRYVIVFIVAALADYALNKMSAKAKNPGSAVRALQKYYGELSECGAMLMAGVTFVIIYFICDAIFQLLFSSSVLVK